MHSPSPATTRRVRPSPTCARGPARNRWPSDRFPALSAFLPTNTDLAFHDAVWLPSDGTFGTSRANPIVMNAPGLAEIQGRFHHWRGCFWLENPIGNNMVRLAGVTLKSNDMVPLVNGIILELGPTKMRVEILA